MMLMGRFFGGKILLLWYLFLFTAGLGLIGIWGLTGYRKKDSRLLLGIGSLVLFLPYAFYPVMLIQFMGYSPIFESKLAILGLPVMLLCAGTCAFLGGYSLAPAQKPLPPLIASGLLVFFHFLLMIRNVLLFFPLFFFWSVVLIMMVFAFVEAKKEP